MIVIIIEVIFFTIKQIQITLSYIYIFLLPLYRNFLSSCLLDPRTKVNASGRSSRFFPSFLRTSHQVFPGRFDLFLLMRFNDLMDRGELNSVRLLFLFGLFIFGSKFLHKKVQLKELIEKINCLFIHGFWTDFSI